MGFKTIAAALMRLLHQDWTAHGGASLTHHHHFLVEGVMVVGGANDAGKKREGSWIDRDAHVGSPGERSKVARGSHITDECEARLRFEPRDTSLDIPMGKKISTLKAPA